MEAEATRSEFRQEGAKAPPSGSQAGQGTGLGNIKPGFNIRAIRTRTYLLRPNGSPQIRKDGGTTSFYIAHLGIQGIELGPSTQGFQSNGATKDMTRCADQPPLDTSNTPWRLCSTASPSAQKSFSLNPASSVWFIRTVPMPWARKSGRGGSQPSCPQRVTI